MYQPPLACTAALLDGIMIWEQYCGIKSSEKMRGAIRAKMLAAGESELDIAGLVRFEAIVGLLGPFVQISDAFWPLLLPNWAGFVTFLL